MNRKIEQTREQQSPGMGAPQLYRRQFLVGAVAATSVVPLLSGPASATAAVSNSKAASAAATKANELSPSSSVIRGYESFSLDEAAFVENMVNVMCPADVYTPSGVDCGLAIYIDRQLAGGFGKGERLYMRGPWGHGKPQLGYQLPLTPEQYFKAGLVAANEACRKVYSKDFADLPPHDADRFLQGLSTAKYESRSLSLSSWFNELVYPLFEQACYADPMYGGNRDKVFWKMIGYPGLPATYTIDMTRFRGKPYPGRRHPEAIPDFS